MTEQELASRCARVRANRKNTKFLVARKTIEGDTGNCIIKIFFLY